jgi:hypothetical protein
VLTTVAFVVLVLACGGFSLAFMSARSHLHDMAVHHEALQEELTFSKNHLHHVEASRCYCCSSPADSNTPGYMCKDTADRCSHCL